MGKRPLRFRPTLCALFLIASACCPAADGSHSAWAQTCGTDYVIQPNENLTDIAQRAYGDPHRWSVIFYANGDKLENNTSLVTPGLTIKIPCLTDAEKAATRVAVDPAPASAAAQPGALELSTMVRRIEFLTADGYEPFAGRSLANGGMLTDVLGAAMDLIKDQAKGNFDYGISWVNDRGAHLNPLLISRAFDAGFPWTKPSCENLADLDNESRYRCQKFFFSAPLSEVLTLLFVRADAPGSFATDDEIVGKRLCQPQGGSTYDLDKGGRNWVKDNRITLMRPPTIEECFRWLENDTVDAVVAPDLVGRAHLAALGLTDRIRAVDRPLAVGTLHAIISKTHPYARTMLYYINASIASLRDSGEYDRIIERHLTDFWDAQEKKAPAAAPSASAEKAKTPPPEKPAAPGQVSPKDSLKKGIARKETPN
jgi:polar amino acid transport system substrate-binding protein